MLSPQRSRQAIGIFGEPAIGKTTLMRELIKGIGETQQGKIGVMDYVWSQTHRVMVVGSYKGHPYDGTDRLSIAIYPQAAELLALANKHMDVRVLIWEGDRMARRRWLDAVEDAGYSLRLLHLIASKEVTDQRRNKRGSTQNEQWVNGRRKLCSNLAIAEQAHTYCMDTEERRRTLVEVILGWMKESP